MPDAKDLAVAIGILYALADVSLAKRANVFDVLVAQACAPRQKAKACSWP
jgi:hypothetical protein